MGYDEREALRLHNWRYDVARGLVAFFVAVRSAAGVPVVLRG